MSQLLRVHMPNCGEVKVKEDEKAVVIWKI